MRPCRPPRRVAILGTGLSGLSLALALLRHEDRPELVLVDRRETFPRDRTWCAWETAAWPISGAARHRWDAWRVRADGREAVHRRAPVPYACWSSDALHERALARLARAGAVTLRLGERVRTIDPEAGTVRTDRGTVEADLLVDALGLTSPLLRGHPLGRGPRGADAAAASPGLVQSFLGLEVETEHPVFDPGVVDLMDFDALPVVPGLARFLYVLPFSPTRALVEDTTFGPTGIPAPRRRRALERRLADLGAGAWRVVHEERGNLPMSTHAFPARHGRRCWTAGTGAGALRPSSGYALARIQRHAARTATAITAGLPGPPGVGAPRARPLDAVLLAGLRDEPGAAPGWFRDLVAGTDPGTFARFMSDVASWRDELRVAAASPVARFAGIAAGELLGRRPARSRGGP